MLTRQPLSDTPRYWIRALLRAIHDYDRIGATPATEAALARATRRFYETLDLCSGCGHARERHPRIEGGHPSQVWYGPCVAEDLDNGVCPCDVFEQAAISQPIGREG